MTRQMGASREEVWLKLLPQDSMTAFIRELHNRLRGDNARRWMHWATVSGKSPAQLPVRVPWRLKRKARPACRESAGSKEFADGSKTGKSAQPDEPAL